MLDRENMIRKFEQFAAITEPGMPQSVTISAETVREAPVADVEPVRHGYWYFRGGRPCCSVCNTKALWKDEGGTGGFSHEFVGAKSKWCPECGAKMDKEADNGDK